jgi:acetoin utilization deacetylase AcuC-like enzyme/GNAT superfamily N-acetyltransferase
MFEIHRVHDGVLPLNRERLARCSEILLQQIPTCTEDQRYHLRTCLHDPLATRFRSIVLVAERRHKVLGFALLMFEPALKFCYLDYLCVAPKRSSGGIGGALYERLRGEAKSLGAEDLFFECWPDDGTLLHDPAELPLAIARLRFYERFGARPILGTYWDSPGPVGAPVTHLMFDDLGTHAPLRRLRLQKVMRAILERRYKESVAATEIDRYLQSVKTDTVEIRPRKYVRTEPQKPNVHGPNVPLFVSHQHEEHHVLDRGYFESRARFSALLPALQKSGLFKEFGTNSYPDSILRAVHRKDYLDFLTLVVEGKFLPQTRPDVFHPRHHKRAPLSPAAQLGYFSSDAFTPLYPSAVVAARRAVDTALSATDAVLAGAPIAYAAVRPPGHHAEAASLGGYCYLSNSALCAAFALRTVARVAILDLDYHHGNGQQEIFYRRNDVLTVSVHADPADAYPFFSGHASEEGTQRGHGYNCNIPLPSSLSGSEWIARGVTPAIERVSLFRPELLVLALGLDTAAGDPTGTWSVKAEDFKQTGKRIGELRLPTVVVQEGGYRTRTLGANAVAFFTGLIQGRGLLG